MLEKKSKSWIVYFSVEDNKSMEVPNISSTQSNQSDIKEDSMPTDVPNFSTTQSNIRSGKRYFVNIICNFYY